jgi:Heterokaryon incompatibility protein (HET)
MFDNSRHHYVMIGRNLASAFRHLRLPNRNRALWADALSIDQTNLDEKASQVAQMSRIFAGPNQVIAWLGDGTDVTAQAFPLLQSIATKLDEIGSLNVSQGIYWRYALGLDLEDFRKILTFFCDPYFERI